MVFYIQRNFEIDNPLVALELYLDFAYRIKKNLLPFFKHSWTLKKQFCETFILKKCNLS